MRDTYYTQDTDLIEAFRFDESVVPVFDDMIRRSVPGYAFTLSLIRVVAQHYFQPNSMAYDLGCSTGASTLACAQIVSERHGKVVALDNSLSMIEQCRSNLLPFVSQNVVECCHQDVTETLFSDSSLMLLNFTLQFIHPEKRIALLSSICNSMLSGGVLVLSEKIVDSDEHNDALLKQLHHQFKYENGYSALEISRKRSALEGVLISQTREEHEAVLKEAGFAKVILVHQAFNFVTLLAFKS